MVTGMIAELLDAMIEGPGGPGEPWPDPAALGEAIAAIMEGEVPPAQIAALLMGLRMRGERPEHLKATVEVMLGKATAFPRPEGLELLVDTCGPGGVGRSTLNTSTATALVCATAGIPTAKHGNRSVTSVAGSADTLEALGVKIDCPPQTSARMLAETGFCFVFAPLYHPAMRHAGPVRRELGIRSIFNLAGPLSNPAGPTHQLVGVGRRALMQPIAETLALLGRKGALVVHGRNGMDEVSLDQVTEGLRVHENGRIEDVVIEPGDFGVSVRERADLVITSPADSAARIRRILEGEGGPASDEINANVAAVMWLVGRANSVEEGFLRAQEIQQSGAAAKTLDRVVELSNGG